MKCRYLGLDFTALTHLYFSVALCMYIYNYKALVVTFWFLRSNWQNSHQFLLESVRPLNHSASPHPSIHLLSTKPLLLVLQSFSFILNPCPLSFYPSPLYSTPAPRSFILLLSTQPLLLVLQSFSFILKPYFFSFYPSPLYSLF